MINFLIPSARHRNKLYRLFVDFLIRPRMNRLNIPVIAVTGTNGKSTITKLLNKIYLAAGYHVGMCCTDGVMRNGSVVCKGDKAGASGLWRLTIHRGLDLIVAETSRGGILRHGLGFSECQVGVVTNIYEDHMGQDGIDTLEKMADVKSAIPRVTSGRGTVVLNFDDPLVRRMARKSKGNIIYFTMDDKPAGNSISKCFFLKDEVIWKKSNDMTEPVIRVNDVAITSGGMLRYHVANTMAVLAVVEAMKDRFPVADRTLNSILVDFGNNLRDNMARFSLLRYQSEALLLCFCKNPECYYRDLPLILKLKEKGGFDYLVGILCAVGGRPLSYYQDISTAAAPACDAFSIHSPKAKYFRGHSADEIISFLSSAIPPDKILNGNTSTLEKVFRRSRERFTGKILFVAFWALFDSGINFEKVLAGSVPEKLPGPFPFRSLTAEKEKSPAR